MNCKELKLLIDALAQDFEFQYNGQDGSICPFSRECISMSYGSTEKTFNSVESVMETPFFDGKSLNDVCSDFIFY